MQSFETLNDVFSHQIADLYDAERQLVEALPKMAQAASDELLQQAFEHHLGRDTGPRASAWRTSSPTSDQPVRASLRGDAGLIEEGEEIDRSSRRPAAPDAALIAAAQRVEHYEIAAYGTARTLADDLGLDEAKDLLDQTLNEESNADKLLTKIATGGMFKAGINERATA